jgi:hypothetical protein
MYIIIRLNVACNKDIVPPIEAKRSDILKDTLDILFISGNIHILVTNKVFGDEAFTF